MPPRQTRIPGTERPDIPQELEDAGEELLEARSKKRSDARKNNERTKEKEISIVTLMRSHDVPNFSVKDPETGEILEFGTQTKLVIRKSAESEPDYAEDITPSSGPTDGVHPGLIRQAQDDANVEVNGDGDVVVPEKAARKAAPKKKPKKKAKGN